MCSFYYASFCHLRKARPRKVILYQAAVLELDAEALPHRVEAAKAAIHSRVAELEQARRRARMRHKRDCDRTAPFRCPRKLPSANPSRNWATLGKIISDRGEGLFEER
jgi:hypothetical protein